MHRHRLVPLDEAIKRLLEDVARDAPRAQATLEVIDTRTGEVRVVPVPGVWVKAGPREVFTLKPALAP